MFGSQTHKGRERKVWHGVIGKIGEDKTNECFVVIKKKESGIFLPFLMAYTEEIGELSNV